VFCNSRSQQYLSRERSLDVTSGVTRNSGVKISRHAPLLSFSFHSPPIPFKGLPPEIFTLVHEFYCTLNTTFSTVMQWILSGTRGSPAVGGPLDCLPGLSILLRRCMSNLPLRNVRLLAFITADHVTPGDRAISKALKDKHVHRYSKLLTDHLLAAIARRPASCCSTSNIGCYGTGS